MAHDQNTVRALYKKLLNLYPRDFNEQMGESMEQTFIDLCNERAREREQGWLGFVLWMFIETAIGISKEYILRITQGDAMKNSLTKPRSAAIISFVLCLPFAFLFTLLMLNIEPNFGPLQPLLNNADPDQPDVLGSLIALGTFLLVLAAFIINLIQIVRTMQAGGSITTHPVNLVLAVATLATIAVIIGAIIVDQYPCWIGVPNCD
jgi:uncharacterized membrane protein YidH (DUF202 family)